MAHVLSVPLIDEQILDDPEVSEVVSEVQDPFPLEEEDKPLYGSKRYEIVDQALRKVEEKAVLDAISPV
jgi:hypothetical protein